MECYSWASSTFYSLIHFNINKTATFRINETAGTRRIAIAMGLANRLFQVGIVVWYMVYLIADERYKKIEKVTGHTRSWIGAGDLYARHNAYEANPSTVSSLCTDTRKYWYQTEPDCNKLESRTVDCEHNITCTYPEYAHANRKMSEAQLAVFTYVKRTKYTAFPCSAGISCAADEESWASASSVRCKCWKTTNRFLLGVEQMELVIAHDFKELTTLSTRLLPEQRSWKSMKTRIVRNRLEGDEVHVFEKGQPISASVEQWLKWSGVESLDHVSEQAKLDYTTIEIPGSNNLPVHRMTGITLNLELNYDGYVYRFSEDEDPNLECVIVISAMQGYTSFGSDPTVVDRYSEGDYVVEDRFLRGIKFELSSQGSVGEFSFTNLFVSMTVVLVYLQLVPGVLHMVFYGLGLLFYMCSCCSSGGERRGYQLTDYIAHESRVWHEGCNENVDLEHIHVKRLLHVLMIRLLFSSSGTLKDKTRISYREAVAMMKSLIGSSQTTKLSGGEKELAVFAAKQSTCSEMDKLRFQTEKINERDIERLMTWLFQAAYPKLKNTPMEERHISVNRFAALLGGDPEGLTLADCLRHATWDRDSSVALQKIIPTEIPTELPLQITSPSSEGSPRPTALPS